MGRLKLFILSVLLSTILLSVPLAKQASALVATFDWISRDFNGEGLNDNTNGASAERQGISADGRYVIFNTAATDVVAGDANGYRDLFIRDRQTGLTNLVSVGSSGQQGNNHVDNGRAAISGDGRYVVFSTLATNFASPDFNNASDLFLRDTQAGTTTRICSSEFNGYSCESSSIGRDGRYITYRQASPLSYGAVAQLYRYDLTNGQSQLVTQTSSGLVANAITTNWSGMSPDGRYVVFNSSATNLVPGDTNARTDIFRKDMVTGEIVRVSTTSAGLQANQDSQWPTISDDGRYVVFTTVASNLVANDTNNNWDLYVKDLQLNTVKLVGGLLNLSQLGTISGDAAHIVYQTSVPGIVPSDTNSVQDVYSWEITTNMNTRVSQRSDSSSLGIHGSGAGNITPDGRFTLIFTNNPVDPSDINIAQDIYVNDRGQPDVVGPQITGTPDRQSTAAGWYNNDVTISWSVTDPIPSSGVPTTPPPTIATLEGTHTYTSEPSCDPAGNCTTGAITISIDKTSPDISYELSPLPNVFGWNNTEVTTTFVCTDNSNPQQSGVDTCNPPLVIPAGNGSFTLLGAVTDKAGNSTSTSTVINLDNTNPTIDAEKSPVSNSEGWNNTDVSVSFSCEDNLSMVLTCPDIVSLATEGFGQTVTGSTLDNAGNSQSTTEVVNIDKSLPTLGIFAWGTNPKPITNPTTLVVPASDATSGLKYAEYFVGDIDPGLGNASAMTLTNQQTNAQNAVVSADLNAAFGTELSPGVHAVNVRAQDKAGNWTELALDYLVVFDPNGPTDFSASKQVVPSIVNGDVLPGLLNNSQNDKASLGFNALYTVSGSVDPISELSLDYSTGRSCNGPSPVNCHTTNFTATTYTPNFINWLVINGANNSVGTFQGVGTLKIDGVTTSSPFRVQGNDGSRTVPLSNDSTTLYIYDVGANPGTATALYRININTNGNWLKIN